ncbi:NACHT domain-containing protein [Verrucomicrobium spinosum]|uniref:NACHT domain-containing protein n=1 Tax=Verrucomicrobium spinosum TaxID=2736 RepID=UPI0001744C68|nr:NACHT domain-containing protein [Verrucomicrobium spinosum]
MAELLTTATVALTNFVWTQLEKYVPLLYKKIGEEVKLRSAIHTYLSRYQDAYGSIKPIGMTSPIPLEKIYTEVQFTTEDLRRHFCEGALERSALRDLRHLIDKSKIETLHGIDAANRFQRLLVVGHPGGGKSTYLRRVGWECLRSHGILKERHSGKARYEHALLPVLLEMKRFRSGESTTLIELLTNELVNCGFPESEAMVEGLLEAGKLLILLDALDEVAQDRVESTVEQALELVRRYPECRFIISCRVAFQHDYFSNFQDVTLLDFTDGQIDHFITNWFSSAEQRAEKIAERFIRQLHDQEHAATLELARSPVLLGYLCMVYDRTLTPFTNRAEIYRRALDIYLEEWNARELKKAHAGRVHAMLPHETELRMLAHIAYHALKQEKFFLTKDEWMNAIQGYVSGLVEKPKGVSPADLLNGIAVSQGLVVQRTHLDWSFSHLTLQEYLAAFHIDQADLIEETVECHLGEDRWLEVFLILAGMRPARLLRAMVRIANLRVHSANPGWASWCRHLQS